MRACETAVRRRGPGADLHLHPLFPPSSNNRPPTMNPKPQPQVVEAGLGKLSWRSGGIPEFIAEALEKARTQMRRCVCVVLCCALLCCVV